jgi:hypothetical protein
MSDIHARCLAFKRILLRAARNMIRTSRPPTIEQVAEWGQMVIDLMNENMAYFSEDLYHGVRTVGVDVQGLQEDLYAAVHAHQERNTAEFVRIIRNMRRDWNIRVQGPPPRRIGVVIGYDSVTPVILPARRRSRSRSPARRRSRSRSPARARSRSRSPARARSRSRSRSPNRRF